MTVSVSGLVEHPLELGHAGPRGAARAGQPTLSVRTRSTVKPWREVGAPGESAARGRRCASRRCWRRRRRRRTLSSSRWRRKAGSPRASRSPQYWTRRCSSTRLPHFTDGHPLPEEKGGPVRFLIPNPAACGTAEVDTCANVKWLNSMSSSRWRRKAGSLRASRSPQYWTRRCSSTCWTAIPCRKRRAARCASSSRTLQRAALRKWTRART